MDKIFTDKISKLSRQTGNFARIACILEVTTEKPGNVTPTHNFTDTKFEDFVFGSVFIGDAVEKAFIDGYTENFRTGKRIYDFVKGAKNYNKTNTHFGIALLFIPLAAAFGMCVKKENKINEMTKRASAEKLETEKLRDAIAHVMEKTDVNDTVYLHKAIKTGNVSVPKDKLCIGKSGIDKFEISQFDILSENFIKTAKRENITFYEMMKISAAQDIIAKELTTRMEISFKYSSLLCINKRILRKDVLSLFLSMLSKFPDTFIAKKHGKEISENISSMAADVLKGKLNVEKFTGYLNSHNINPGSTADITANIIFLCLLKRIFLK